MFSLPSQTEIDTVLKLGVSPQKIIYANPCKTNNYIRHAASVGVDLMTFDNEPELFKIAAQHPTAKLVLRIKVDDSHSICKFSAKFGADLDSAARLLFTAKSLGLEIIGVSFHVGSGCESADSFRDAVKNARFVFDLAKQLGFDMRLLDLGGGWPGTSNAKVTFEQMAKAVSSALEEYFPEEDEHGNNSSIEVIAEPGRYYVASAMVLATMVIAKRPMVLDDGSNGVMYYMNDGVYGSFNCTIFDHWVGDGIPFLSETVLQERPVLQSTVWGPTCDSMDLILKDVQMPEMEVGEWVIFKEMGAYTIAAASTFNGFQIPSMKFFVPLHTLEALKRLPQWNSIARVLDVDDEAAMMSSDSEEEDAFCADFEHALIAVH